MGDPEKLQQNTERQFRHTFYCKITNAENWQRIRDLHYCYNKYVDASYEKDRPSILLGDGLHIFYDMLRRGCSMLRFTLFLNVNTIHIIITVWLHKFLILLSCIIYFLCCFSITAKFSTVTNIHTCSLFYDEHSNVLTVRCRLARVQTRASAVIK